MSEARGKTYRPWAPQHYRQELHSPEGKLPEGDLVFFLLDSVPQLDLGRFYTRHWFSLMGICFPFPMNRLCHLHVENFTHRQPPFDHAQSDSGDFSGRKMDAKKIVDHPIDM